VNYLSFALVSIFVGWFTVDDIQVVLVESPPLFLGFSGYILSKLKGAKFLLNVSDLWPESAVVVGLLQNRRLIRWAILAEEWLYRHAVLVTGQTQGIVDSISKRCPETRTVLMTNGVSPEFLVSATTAVASRDRVRLEFGTKDKFVVGYAGLHGLVYRLDMLLSAAGALAKYEDVHFLLIGDGPEKNRLQEKAKIEALHNVTFLPTLPAVRMPEVFTAMDVVVVPLKRHELFKGTLPSKLFEAMGAGVPVIGALEGEARRIIETSECGLCVEPENSQALAEGILKLFHDAALRKRLGENGREYVMKHYNRKDIAARFDHILSDLVAASPLIRTQKQAPSGTTWRTTKPHSGKAAHGGTRSGGQATVSGKHSKFNC
jgi:glycosyltransferase involved in cell wall biosynthesis